jgi:hypothetical protein
MHFGGGGGYLAMYTTIVQMAAEPEAIEDCKQYDAKKCKFTIRVIKTK